MKSVTAIGKTAPRRWFGISRDAGSAELSLLLRPASLLGLVALRGPGRAPALRRAAMGRRRALATRRLVSLCVLVC